MGAKVSGKCKKCGKKAEQEGIRGEGAGRRPFLCVPCLESIYPEGRELPLAMDKDGNLYYTDKARNCMVIFFSYGDVPYSSCTEVSLDDEEWGCGFSMI